MFYLDYTGTERQELVPRCADCGEHLDADQATEFFADLDRSAL